MTEVPCRQLSKIFDTLYKPLLIEAGEIVVPFDRLIAANHAFLRLPRYAVEHSAIFAVKGFPASEFVLFADGGKHIETTLAPFVFVHDVEVIDDTLGQASCLSTSRNGLHHLVVQSGC